MLCPALRATSTGETPDSSQSETPAWRTEYGTSGQGAELFCVIAPESVCEVVPAEPALGEVFDELLVSHRLLTDAANQLILGFLEALHPGVADQYLGLLAFTCSPRRTPSKGVRAPHGQ